MNKKIGNLFTILGIVFFIGVLPVVFAVIISILLSKVIPISKSGLFFIIIILANILIFLAKLLDRKSVV